MVELLKPRNPTFAHELHPQPKASISGRVLFCLRGGGSGHDFAWELGGFLVNWIPNHRRGGHADLVMKPSLRTSVMIALAQTGVLVVGILAVAASNRVAHEMGHRDLRDYLFFMNYGWLLLVLPLIWVTVAGRILLRSRQPVSREGTVFLSGIVLLVTLVCAMATDAIQPWRTPAVRPVLNNEQEI